jgi:hypothetical protein
MSDVRRDEIVLGRYEQLVEFRVKFRWNNPLPRAVPDILFDVASFESLFAWQLRSF